MSVSRFVKHAGTYTVNANPTQDVEFTWCVKQLPTYVHDTNHALNLLADFRFESTDGPRLIFTMDIQSVYKYSQCRRTEDAQFFSESEMSFAWPSWFRHYIPLSLMINIINRKAEKRWVTKWDLIIRVCLWGLLNYIFVLSMTSLFPLTCIDGSLMTSLVPHPLYGVDIGMALKSTKTPKQDRIPLVLA
jgi:hypothetical protein